MTMTTENKSQAEEYLTAADLSPGKRDAIIEYASGGMALKFKEFKKLFVMTMETFLRLARDFNEGDSRKWSGRRVKLSVSGDDICIKASVVTTPPAVPPKQTLASDLADLLSRAISTHDDRVGMVRLLRDAADLLLARRVAR